MARRTGGGLLAALMAGMLAACMATPASAARSAMRIGVQLYSVRDACAKDFPGTIAAVGKMGYEAVEFAGYYGRSAEEVRKLIDAAGLKCCGTHTGLDSLLGPNFDATVKFNQVIGNKFLIVPGLSRERTATREAWLETARIFNEIAKKLKPYGMRVGYHNHTGEFQVLDGEVPFDTFFSHTDRSVVMQMDIGHATHGAGDPMPYLLKYPGRATTVHVKEWDPKNGTALVGEGIVPWAKVLANLKRKGGTEWLIVEQETYAITPLESIEKNLANLRKMLSDVR